MKVIYTAPNRAHHYRYAIALQKAGCLYAFVSGFPRISKRASIPEINGKLYHADILQTLYLAILKANLFNRVSIFLAYLSKIEQDYACEKFMKNADIFLYYNGCGLSSGRIGKKQGVITIVEAVNSHVEYQEFLLQEEYDMIGLPWEAFLKKEKKRRLQEYEEADYILVPSEFVKRSFIDKGFPCEKILKVSYGFRKSTETTESKKYSSTDTFTVLYVGSISVRKGIRYLVEGFKRVIHPKKKLLLVGPNINDGALNGIQLTPDIVLTGTLKGEKLEKIYNEADVFCLPSIEDGFGLVLGEALSAGLAIITTCNTGGHDIISNSEQGFIIPIRDSEAIRDKLQILADNPELLQQLRSNSYAKSEKLNGWAETGKNLIDTLINVNLNR